MDFSTVKKQIYVWWWVAHLPWYRRQICQKQ